MLPFPLTLLLSILLILFGGATVFLIAALFIKPVQKPSTRNSLPGISIVIPFRNEENNLENLLNSLATQSYKGEWEILLINDQSSDNGPQIVVKYQTAGTFKPAQLRLETLIPENSILTSKQQALELGISKAKYPLVALTDADMVLDPHWLENMVSSQETTQADLLFGHTSISSGTTSILKMLESFQLEFLFSYAFAFSKLNLTGSCMGNNLLLVKSAYLKSGGQNAIGYTIVEDRALLELFRKKGFKTAAQEPFIPLATTKPCTSVNQFYHQMRRWAAGGFKPGSLLFAAGILLSTQIVLMLLSALGLLPLILFAMSATNFFLTWLLVLIAFRKIRSPQKSYLFPLYYIFLTGEVFFFAFSLIINPSIKWKNRVVR